MWRMCSTSSRSLVVLMLLLLAVVCLLQPVSARVNILSASASSSPSYLARNALRTGPVKLVSIDSILSLRGGEAIKKTKSGKMQPVKKTALESIKEILGNIEPVARVYLFVCLFTTLVQVVGLPAAELFSLKGLGLLTLFKPITAAAYLGGLSLSMANNIYFIVRYGQTIEKEYGSTQFLYFLGIQCVLLTAMSLLLGFPFTANSMIAAIIYVCSRIYAMEPMPFQFGLMITSWQLPFCMMIIDCLSQKTVAAAWPHVLGIFSGHIYHFFKDIWPQLGGKECFVAPAWLYKVTKEKKSKSNIKGFQLSKDKDEEGKKKKKSKVKGRKA